MRENDKQFGNTILWNPSRKALVSDMQFQIVRNMKLLLACFCMHIFTAMAYKENDWWTIFGRIVFNFKEKKFVIDN